MNDEDQRIDQLGDRECPMRASRAATCGMELSGNGVKGVNRDAPCLRSNALLAPLPEALLNLFWSFRSFEYKITGCGGLVKWLSDVHAPEGHP